MRRSPRHEADFYETPAYCVTRLLEKLTLPGGHWLEPCAGGGAIIRAVNAFRQDVVWSAGDLVARYPSDIPLPPRYNVVCDGAGNELTVDVGDFLTAPDPVGVDVVFTNPPYTLAMEFLTKSLRIARHVVMLLRINFLESEKRAEFMRVSRPDMYVLPNRPSFTGGGTDMTGYCWLYFDSKRERESHWFILDSTPKGERR